MAASNSDLKAHATSTTDFYALLGVNANFSKNELDSAWRKTALKYHPDKAGASETAREKFHLANIAYELLSDPALHQLYKNAREARERRWKQDELMHGARRQMRQDLERRERAAAATDALTGIKRARDETLEAEEKLQQEIDRIAADGKKRRLEREEKLRKQMEEEQKKAAEESRTHQERYIKEGSQQLGQPSDIQKSITVKFTRAPDGQGLNEITLREMFSTFGNIEALVMRGDKRERVEGAKHKRIVGRALILYTSLIETYSAIEDWRKHKSPGGGTGAWLSVVDVSWAEGKEPDCLNTPFSKPPPSTDGSVPKFSSFESSARENAQKAPSGSVNLDELKRQRMEHDEERRRELERLESEI